MLGIYEYFLLPKRGSPQKRKSSALSVKRCFFSTLQSIPSSRMSALKRHSNRKLTYLLFISNKSLCLTEKPSHCTNFFHDRSKLQLPAASFPSWEHSSQSETLWIYGSYLGHGASASSQLKVPRLHSRPRILQRSEEESTGKKTS